jgi:hypothetical protein
MATPDIQPDLWTNLGVLIAAAVAALAGYFGPRLFGKPPLPDKTVEVAGALVDARSVERLTAAIEAHNMEIVAIRHDAEKARQVGHKLVDAIEQVAGELEELRRGISDIRVDLARMK